MRIRDLALPSEFVSCIERGLLRRERGSWLLRFDRDAFGNPWESELGDVYETIEEIESESNLLPKHFPPDTADTPDMFADQPGFIPYITDFSRILAFAIAGDGAPFCFDYRDQGDQPSVIWWDDAYWRRVAPDFVTFLDLFDLNQSA